MITYEYPLNERIRTLLRLDDVFERVAHFVAAEGPAEHHVALVTLFEILEVAGRADLKSILFRNSSGNGRSAFFQKQSRHFRRGAERRAL